MPIPQVTCCICNQVVNKAQTLSLGQGRRACRTHETVADQATQAQAELKEKFKVKPKPSRDTSFPYNEVTMNPRCAQCDKEGVTIEQFKNGVEDLGLKLDDIQLAAAMVEFQANEGLVILNVFRYDPKMKLGTRAKQMGEMFGFVGLCIECARNSR